MGPIDRRLAWIGDSGAGRADRADAWGIIWASFWGDGAVAQGLQWR